jgi:hypothetical protein
MEPYPPAEFASVLLASPTFLPAVALWGGLCLACFVLAASLFRRMSRRVRWRSLHSDVRGAAAAVDFVLTLPFFLTVVLLSVQFAVLLNASMIVHYSAFAAARSARVWVVESTADNLNLLGDPIPDSTPFGDLNPFGTPFVSQEARQRAEDAARFALIAASPADPEIRSSGGTPPQGVLAQMAAAGDLPDRSDALLQKARYAFDPRNSSVEIEHSILARSAEVTATVVFHQPCGILIGRVFGTDRGDGVYYTPITAEVTLL